MTIVNINDNIIDINEIIMVGPIFYGRISVTKNSEGNSHINTVRFSFRIYLTHGLYADIIVAREVNSFGPLEVSDVYETEEFKGYLAEMNEHKKRVVDYWRQHSGIIKEISIK